jgi:Xaa-Pro aminopeptidase
MDHDAHRARVEKLRRLMARADLAALLVTKPVNVTYLTGFTGGDSFLLVTPDQAIVLSDFRFIIQLEQECPGLEVQIRPTGVTLGQLTAKVVQQCKLRQLGVEAESMSVSLYQQLGKLLPATELAVIDGLVEQLRLIKERAEVDEIRRSVAIAQRALAVIRARLQADQTEQEIATELEYQIRQLGGSGCSFPPIVAVGARSALPHAVPTKQTIGESAFVLIDWGAFYRGYASDLTRLLTTAKISPKLERIYGVVLTAQQRAIAAIRPGARLCDVDAEARRVIAEAGFGKLFGHGLGHGLGLEIHEAPRLAVGQDQPLRAGMVVTVEPGVYVPGFGGVRIEDDVLVTRDGHEVLSDVPKALEDCKVSGVMP